MQKSDPLDVGFVRVIATTYRKQRKRQGQEKNVTTKFEVREYGESTTRGRFQLWVDDIYKKDITSEVLAKRSRDHYVIAWSDYLPGTQGVSAGGATRVEALLNQLAEFT